MKKKRTLKVLVACEESQATTKALRKLNNSRAKIYQNWEIAAFSCDLLPCSGGHPEWHHQGDVFDIIDQGWDLMIAHPPCTYLAVSGAQWYYHPKDKHLPIENRRPHPKYPLRAKHREEALKFFVALADADIDFIAAENPIGVISTKWRKPDQIVQPYMFGDSARKTTCLWLKRLNPLKETKMVDEGERVVFKSGKSQPKWYADAFSKAKTAAERSTLRSKTFPGMAKAMARQWTEQVIKYKELNVQAAK